MNRVTLPGGYWYKSERVRYAFLRPLTGAVERKLGVIMTAGPTPSAVSKVLALAADFAGPAKMTSESAAQLCVADRQWLMLHIGAALSGDQVWLQCQCRECGTSFDLGYLRSQVPCSEAGPTFPFVDVALPQRTLRMRVPTGEDQQFLHSQTVRACAEQLVLQRCILAAEKEGHPLASEAVLSTLTCEDIQTIEAALDAVAPAVATSIATRCFGCQARQQVSFDPYDVWNGNARASAWSLDAELHRIASTYHWSEREILKLSRTQRQRYLALIDRDRGLTN